MNIFKKIKMSLRFQDAIRRANDAHKENNHRYYVMPIFNTDGHLVVMDRQNFRMLKQKGYISDKVKVNDLLRECFYCTPYSNGTGALDDYTLKLKRKQFFAWVDSIKK
jgi:hypothetical protein